jgi:hypothetical protein
MIPILRTLHLSRSPALLVQCRGYKKDPDRKPCVFGNQETKIPIYYNFDQGLRETDPDAVRRFYRLHWGGWIRTKGGRRTKLWYKPGEDHWWMRQHIFLSDDQALAMERMITPEYKKERHFVDDIYKAYHKRHYFESLPRGKTEKKTNYFDLMYEY